MWQRLVVDGIKNSAARCIRKLPTGEMISSKYQKLMPHVIQKLIA
jgi:hypothetical protein